MLNKITLIIFLTFVPIVYGQQAVDPYVFDNPIKEERFYQLSEQLRCLVCQNQTLLDSDAPLAKNLRQQIYEKIQSGDSDTDIMVYLSDRYGDFIFYQPPVNKSTGLLWFGPLLLLLLAVGILIIVIRRARKQYQGEK